MLSLSLPSSKAPRRPAVSDRAIEAEDALARLDERLASSPIRDGWIARTDFADACASLRLEGEFVTLEDLVLHDAAMDIRTPTHELTRAHLMLRGRRRILAAALGWASTRPACDLLCGKLAGQGTAPPPRPATPDPLDAELAAIDALIVRSGRVLQRHAADQAIAPDTSSAAAFNAFDAFDTWRQTVAATTSSAPVLAAVTAAIAWQDLRPIDNADWLGRLLAADLLRSRRKTRVHLATLNIGLMAVARDRRQSRNPDVRLDAWLHGLILAAETGLRDHDRWLAAMHGLEHKLKGRRSTSRLPRLIALVMTYPLVSTALVAAKLSITPRSAQDLIAELGLRELTGRSRYRAWGIL